MRSVKVLVFVVALISSLFIPSLYISAQQLGRDCNGEISTYPAEENLTCTYWIVKIYKSNNNSSEMWGAITGKTREDVESQLKKARALQHKVSPNSELNYDSTSVPICDLCGANRNNLTATTKNIKDFIKKYQDLIDRFKLGKKLDGLYKSYLTKDKANPYSGVGSSIKDYGDLLGDALKSQHKLGKMLETLIEKSDLNISYRQFQIEREYVQQLQVKVHAVDQMFRSFPDSLQRELKSGEEDGNQMPVNAESNRQSDTGQLRPTPSCCGYWAAIVHFDSPPGSPHLYSASNVFRSVSCNNTSGYKLMDYVESIIGKQSSPAFFMICEDTRQGAENKIKAPSSYKLVENWSIPDDPHVISP